MAMYIPLLLLLLISLGCAKKSSSRKNGQHTVVESSSSSRPEKQEKQSEDPFEQVAQFLLRSASKKKDLAPYKLPEVRKALSKLSSGQSALKSMDGATHSFRNTFSDKSSLVARYKQFRDAAKPSRKEAAKLYEYVNTVERTMQAAEILQAASAAASNNKKKWLAEAGLEELKRVSITHNKLTCIVSVLAPIKETSSDATTATTATTAAAAKAKAERKTQSRPRRFEANELVIAIFEGGDDATSSVHQVLRIMSQEPQVLALNSVGFVEEEVTVQPTLLVLAAKALQQVQEYLLVPATTASSDNNDTLVANVTPSPPIALENTTTTTTTSTTTIKKLLILGHSGGGAVGAYMAMVLDGALNTSDPSLRNASALVGLHKHRVKCIAIAPPPCISRAVVPKYISSILCGDDIVPRASPDSIASLRARVVKALEAGAGKGGLAWAAGSGWISDLSSIASKGLGEWASKDSEHDLSSLSVPGRAFYLKARKHKGGASLQRVLRGNWREDVLWQIHDILLSKKMLWHHSLDYHIEVLDRL